jgi:branched-chain amino acid transport system permease protein
MASLLGINTDRVIALTFVIGAAMAAVAGVLLGQFYGVINPYIGFMAGMKASPLRYWAASAAFLAR